MDSTGRIYRDEDNLVPAEDIKRLQTAMSSAKELGVEGLTGTMPPAEVTKRTIERCAQCFAELVPYDNGYGGIRMGCVEHGWHRSPIITVPTWLEADIRQHPELARRYIEWVIGNGEE